MPRSRSYEQELMGYLQDSERAVAYLNAALESEDLALLGVALQNVAQARGNVSAQLLLVSLFLLSPE